ncbi:hypothetical protein DSM104299_00636 [Baekduia alba]|uniref:hypothetical protein n=1 Tax=Baekduia alba TaxID=2997333 RepID=UPI0023428437|nr:hypothetical protein [Baekduia alba]WCB91957.1 hypothetical protein DSM104299_00636 [Baekduia alba]
MLRVQRAGLLALLLLSIVPSAAAAAATTFARDGDTVTVTGDDGTNTIMFAPAPGSAPDDLAFSVSGGAATTSGAGCARSGATVTCGVTGDEVQVVADLRGGDDTLRDGYAGERFPALTVAGGAGDDTLSGGDGADALDGGAGDDALAGGGGDDTVIGGPGADRLSGGDGADFFLARDGEVDTLACGGAEDSATVDYADATDAACEDVDRAAAPPAGAGGSGGSTTSPGTTTTPGGSGPSGGGTPPMLGTLPLAVGLGRPRAVRLGALVAATRAKSLSFTATLTQACAATARLTVTAGEARRLHLGRRAATLASAIRAAPAGDVRLALTIKKTYRARLRAARRVRATLTLSCVAASGRASRSIAVTLKR